MKKTVVMLMSGIIAATMLSGCSGNTSSTGESASSTSSGYTEAEKMPELSDEEAAARIKNATLGDTIDTSDYRVNRFSSTSGGTTVETSIYYVDGCYCYVVNDTVVEVQRTVSVRDADATPYDILQEDEIFKGKEIIDSSKFTKEELDERAKDGKTAVAYFYSKGSDGTTSQVTGAKITDRLVDGGAATQVTVEFVDWETEVQGRLYAYVFTLGDAPLNIIGVYTDSESGLVDGTSSQPDSTAFVTSSDSAPEGTTEAADTSTSTAE